MSEYGAGDTRLDPVWRLVLAEKVRNLRERGIYGTKKICITY